MKQGFKLKIFMSLTALSLGLASPAGYATESNGSGSTGTNGGNNIQHLSDEQCMARANQVKDSLESFLSSARFHAPAMEQRTLQLAQALQQNLFQQQSRVQQVTRLSQQRNRLRANSASRVNSPQQEAQIHRIENSIQRMTQHIFENFFRRQNQIMRCSNPQISFSLISITCFDLQNPQEYVGLRLFLDASNNFFERLGVDLLSEDLRNHTQFTGVVAITNPGQAGAMPRLVSTQAGAMPRLVSISTQARTRLTHNTIGTWSYLLTRPTPSPTIPPAPSLSAINLEIALSNSPLLSNSDCRFNVAADGSFTLNRGQNAQNTITPLAPPASSSPKLSSGITDGAL